MIGRLRFIYKVNLEAITLWAFRGLVVFALITGILFVGSQIFHATNGG